MDEKSLDNYGTFVKSSGESPNIDAESGFELDSSIDKQSQKSVEAMGLFPTPKNKEEAEVALDNIKVAFDPVAKSEGGSTLDLLGTEMNDKDLAMDDIFDEEGVAPLDNNSHSADDDTDISNEGLLDEDLLKEAPAAGEVAEAIDLLDDTITNDALDDDLLGEGAKAGEDLQSKAGSNAQNSEDANLQDKGTLSEGAKDFDEAALQTEKIGTVSDAIDSISRMPLPTKKSESSLSNEDLGANIDSTKSENISLENPENPKTSKTSLDSKDEAEIAQDAGARSENNTLELLEPLEKDAGTQSAEEGLPMKDDGAVEVADISGGGDLGASDIQIPDMAAISAAMGEAPKKDAPLDIPDGEVDLGDLLGGGSGGTEEVDLGDLLGGGDGEISLDDFLGGGSDTPKEDEINNDPLLPIEVTFNENPDSQVPLAQVVEVEEEPIVEEEEEKPEVEEVEEEKVAPPSPTLSAPIEMEEISLDDFDLTGSTDAADALAASVAAENSETEDVSADFFIGEDGDKIEAKKAVLKQVDYDLSINEDDANEQAKAKSIREAKKLLEEQGLTQDTTQGTHIKEDNVNEEDKKEVMELLQANRDTISDITDDVDYLKKDATSIKADVDEIKERLGVLVKKVDVLSAAVKNGTPSDSEPQTLPDEELADALPPVGSEAVDESVTGPAQNGESEDFFTSDDEDTALSGDELANIVNNASITEEKVDAITAPDDQMLPPQTSEQSDNIEEPKVDSTGEDASEAQTANKENEEEIEIVEPTLSEVPPEPISSEEATQEEPLLQDKQNEGQPNEGEKEPPLEGAGEDLAKEGTEQPLEGETQGEPPIEGEAGAEGHTDGEGQNEEPPVTDAGSDNIEEPKVDEGSENASEGTTEQPSEAQTASKENEAEIEIVEPTLSEVPPEPISSEEATQEEPLLQDKQNEGQPNEGEKEPPLEGEDLTKEGAGQPSEGEAQGLSKEGEGQVLEGATQGEPPIEGEAEGEPHTDGEGQNEEPPVTDAGSDNIEEPKVDEGSENASEGVTEQPSDAINEAQAASKENEGEPEIVEPTLSEVPPEPISSEEATQSEEPQLENAQNAEQPVEGEKEPPLESEGEDLTKEGAGQPGEGEAQGLSQEGEGQVLEGATQGEPSLGEAGTSEDFTEPKIDGEGAQDALSAVYAEEPKIEDALSNDAVDYLNQDKGGESEDGVEKEVYEDKDEISAPKDTQEEYTEEEVDGPSEEKTGEDSTGEGASDATKASEGLDAKAGAENEGAQTAGLDETLASGAKEEGAEPEVVEPTMSDIPPQAISEDEVALSDTGEDLTQGGEVNDATEPTIDEEKQANNATEPTIDTSTTSEEAQGGEGETAPVEAQSESASEAVGAQNADAPQAAEVQNAAPQKSEQSSLTVDSLSENIKVDVKSVLLCMDKLLEDLPEDKIENFSKTKDFEMYKKLFSELGLS